MLRQLRLATRGFWRERVICWSTLLTCELGLLVVLFGRRFKAGWRSHTQMIAIGLSTAAIAWLAVPGTWQILAIKAHLIPRAE